jgi:voltage-dependent potassium channel beta subunit
VSLCLCVPLSLCPSVSVSLCLCVPLSLCLSPSHPGKTGQDDNVAFECLKAAYDAGCRFFDTAEVYAGGEAEVTLGKAIKALEWRREDLVVTTKIFWGGSGPNDRGLSRKHIIEGMRNSLKRLQLDYVDIVYCHRPDYVTPLEETVRAMNWVIEQGWAFYWGTSEWSAERITQACEIADRLGLIRPVVEQPQYNMLERKRFEIEYGPVYKNYNYATTIWSPLAFGLLTGKYNDGIPEDSRFADADFNFTWKKKILGDEKDELLPKLRALGDVAKKIGATQAQLALAWTLKNDNVTVVLTGASRPSQVVENFKTLQFLDKLTPEIMDEIEAILETKPEPVTSWRD